MIAASMISSNKNWSYKQLTDIVANDVELDILIYLAKADKKFSSVDLSCDLGIPHKDVMSTLEKLTKMKIVSTIQTGNLVHETRLVNKTIRKILRFIAY